MGRNRVFDDLNHVVDASTITKKSKKLSPKSQLLLFFTFMKINNLTHELNKLLIYVIFTLYKVFNLFFIDEILHKIAIYINEYATKHALKKNKFFARKWHFTSKKKFRIYIATYIYIKIYNQNKIFNY